MVFPLVHCGLRLKENSFKPVFCWVTKTWRLGALTREEVGCTQSPRSGSPIRDNGCPGTSGLAAPKLTQVFCLNCQQWEGEGGGSEVGLVAGLWVTGGMPSEAQGVCFLEFRFSLGPLCFLPLHLPGATCSRHHVLNQPFLPQMRSSWVFQLQ